MLFGWNTTITCFSSKTFPRSEPKRIPRATKNDLKIVLLAQRSRGRVQGVHMVVQLAVFGKHFERSLVIFRSMLVSLESIVSRCLWYLGPCWCFWEICLHSIQRSRVCCSVSLLLFSFSFPSPFPFSFLFLFVSLSLFFSCMFSCIMLCLFICYSCPVIYSSFLWKSAQETPTKVHNMS